MSLNHMFWDTCVFIRYLTNDAAQPHFDDIVRFVAEAKAGKRQIYYSIITLAEFLESNFVNSRFGSIRDFFDDMGSACIPIDPDPNIMFTVSALRSAKAVHPNDRKISRVIATPDAIIMASALHARDAYGITDIVLHSTDEGKGKSWAGKTVPIIGFNDWYPEEHRNDAIRRLCSLPKERPIHPEPTLFTGSARYGVSDIKPSSGDGAIV